MKYVTYLTLICSSLYFIACSNGNRSSEAPIIKTAADFPNCKTAFFHVLGMNDKDAPKRVHDAIVALPGIYFGEVDFNTQSSRFVYDSTVITYIQVHQTIQTIEDYQYTIDIYEALPGLVENRFIGKEKYYRKDVAKKDFEQPPFAQKKNY